jgi:transcriptional regulator with XRE-family HTH domain
LTRISVEELVGANIAQARTGRPPDQRMTQAQLGEAIEKYLGRSWSRQAVSLAEQGKRDFTAAELVALAAVLEVPVASLFLPPDDPDREIYLPEHTLTDQDEARLLLALGTENQRLDLFRLHHELARKISAQINGLLELDRRLHEVFNSTRRVTDIMIADVERGTAAQSEEEGR